MFLFGPTADPSSTGGYFAAFVKRRHFCILCGVGGSKMFHLTYITVVLFTLSGHHYVCSTFWVEPKAVVHVIIIDQ